MDVVFFIVRNTDGRLALVSPCRWMYRLGVVTPVEGEDVFGARYALNSRTIVRTVYPEPDELVDGVPYRLDTSGAVERPMRVVGGGA